MNCIRRKTVNFLRSAEEVLLHATSALKMTAPLTKFSVPHRKHHRSGNFTCINSTVFNMIWDASNNQASPLNTLLIEVLY